MPFHLLLTIIVGIVFFIADTNGLGVALARQKWYVLAFFGLLSLFQQGLMQRGFQKSNEYFVQFYLLATVVRLLACLGFVGAFLYFKLASPVPFVLLFFGLYLLYTSFGVLGLYRKLRRDLKH